MISESNPYVFEVEQRILDLTANFEKNPCRKIIHSLLQQMSEKMGSVAVEPQQDTYEAGTEIKVSAVPASEDYEFVGFTKKRNSGDCQQGQSVRIPDPGKYGPDCKL